MRYVARGSMTCWSAERPPQPFMLKTRVARVSTSNAALGLAAHVGIVGRVLHGHPGLGHARADHVLVVVREASARERRDGEQPGDRDRVVDARVQVDSQAAVAHDPVEVGEGRLRLVQESRQPRDGLPHAEELDLRRPLQLGGDRRREVLVPEHVGGEAERIPPLAEEDVRLRVLAGPITEPVAVLPVHEVVGGGIGVELERQPRRDLPVVLRGARSRAPGECRAARGPANRARTPG